MSFKTYSPEIEALIGGGNDLTPDSPALEVTPGVGQPSAIVGDAYEGADRFDRSLAFWNPSLNSADGDILPQKQIADARIRDIVRNDAFVSNGVDIHRDSIVGSQFLLNAKPNFNILGLDETWAAEFQEEVEQKFTLWAESCNNWVDASRMNTLTGLIRLGIGVYMTAGELLSTVEWTRDGRPFQTAIQMVDLDRLSNPPNIMESKFMRSGVERDSYGGPLAYHIQMSHPRDALTDQNYTWRRVPARKPWGRLQVLHIVNQERPDQTRGISRIVAGLKELKITKEFRDVMLQNAVVNATFAASIESELPSEAVFASLGAGTQGAGSGVAEYAAQFLGAVNKYSGGSKNLKIDGVRIPHLFPGTKLQLRPAGQGGPLGTEFEQSLLRYTAANLGVSYEQLSKDYSQTNYSSARAAAAETEKHMMAQKRLVADRMATNIYLLWLEEALNKNLITSLPANAPSFYEGVNAEAYASCEWIGASQPTIDPLKEAQASVLRLQNNLTTYEDEIGRTGKDWRKVLAQREREQKDLVARGLEIDPKSNMMNAVSGAMAKRPRSPK